MSVQKLLASLLGAICLTAASPDWLYAADPPAGQITVSENYGRIPLHFEANQGQAGEAVKYLSRGQGYTLYFGSTEVALALDASTNSQPRLHRHKQDADPNHGKKSAVLRLQLDGAN